jgi:serine/threonine-protein kinase
MLTGRNPFIGADPAATVMNIIRLNPPPPSTVQRSVPAELDTLVARALAKPVEARPAGALGLSSDLRRIAASLDDRERDKERPVRPRAEGERAGVGWLVGAVLLAVLIAVWWYFQGTS